MARSPSGPGQDGPGNLEDYEAGWSAVHRLIRRGFSWSGHERNVALLGMQAPAEGGVPRFADVSAVTGFDHADDGRCAARVDWDFDGDLDLVLSARTGPRARVLLNELPAGNGWLALHLRGAGQNTGAIGAVAEVELEGGARDLLVATRRAGEGYLAQSSAWLHFGLGAGRVREVRVRWPGGATESFGAPRANRHWRLVQGSGRAQPFPAPSVPTIATPEPAHERPVVPARLVTVEPLPVPSIVAQANGQGRSFLGVRPGGTYGTGRTLLVMLFSHTCAPCAAELAAFGQARASFDAAGVELLALSVDPEDELDAVVAFVERAGFHGRVAFTDAESLARLDAVAGGLRDTQRPLPLPASFLFDPEGRLQVVYVGAVEPGQVVVDSELSELEPDLRGLAALPFPGRFVRESEPFDSAWLRGGMERRGLAEAAAELALLEVEARTVGRAQMQLDFGIARIRQERWEVAARHLEQAVELDPGLVEAWKNLGYARHRMGQVEGAREAYARALELDPEDDRNRANLAFALAELGELDAARGELAVLVERESEYAEAVERRLR